MKVIIKSKEQLQKVLNNIKDEEFEKGFVLEIQNIKKYKTDQQNKTFHALLNSFYESGCSSFDNVVDLKNHYKNLIGMDIEYYVYFLADEVFESRKKNKFPIAHKVLEREKIPKKNVIAINKVFQSFSQATSEQVASAIKFLINDIYSSGANSDVKVQKILKGLGEYIEISNEYNYDNNDISQTILNMFDGSKII